MAKSPNGVGQFSGKMGGLVYVVRSGQQIIRNYQPIVANTKSTLQRLQRAKANLVGQISKIVPYQILVGLGDSKVSRRARFLRLALNNATASVSQSDPKTIISKLDVNKFVFSEGAIVPTMSISALTTDRNLITGTISRIGGLNDAQFLTSGAIIVVTMLTTSGDYESVFYRFVDASEFQGNTSLEFSFNHINEGGYIAAAYIAPFKTQDGSSLRARANELFGEGADFAASMVYNPASLPVVYGASEYVRQATFTPSAVAEAKSKK